MSSHERSKTSKESLREWSGSESGEPDFTNVTIVGVVSTLEEVQQEARQLEVATLVVARELAIAKVAEVEVVSAEDELEEIAAVGEAWVQAEAVSRTRLMVKPISNQPNPSPTPSLPQPKNRPEQAPSRLFLMAKSQRAFAALLIRKYCNSCRWTAQRC